MPFACDDGDVAINLLTRKSCVDNLCSKSGYNEGDAEERVGCRVESMLVGRL
jgi:hypothetical protein